MEKSQTPSQSFDCRFEGEGFVVHLSHARMPVQTFSVCLEYPCAEEEPHFSCGFSVFIEQGDHHALVVKKIIDGIARITPDCVDDVALLRLNEVAASWILFNFRPALDSVFQPVAAKRMIRDIGHRILLASVAVQEFALDEWISDAFYL